VYSTAVGGDFGRFLVRPLLGFDARYHGEGRFGVQEWEFASGCQTLKCAIGRLSSASRMKLATQSSR